MSSNLPAMTDSDVAAQRHLEDAVETFDETLPSLEAAAEAMQTTLNDVLDLQHIETGKLRVQKRMAPMLPDMLLNTKQTFASQAEGAGVSLLTFDGHPSSGCMFSHDPPRIRGAVYNFVSNALKWSRPDEVLVRRLSDLRGRSASGKGGAVARPRVVVGCTELPPHLWGADAWRLARSAVGSEVCGKMHQMVTGRPDADQQQEATYASIMATPDEQGGSHECSQETLKGMVSPSHGGRGATARVAPDRASIEPNVIISSASNGSTRSLKSTTGSQASGAGAAPMDLDDPEAVASIRRGQVPELATTRLGVNGLSLDHAVRSNSGSCEAAFTPPHGTPAPPASSAINYLLPSAS